MESRKSLKSLRMRFFPLILPVIFCLFFHGFVSSPPATSLSGEYIAVSPGWTDAGIRLAILAEGGNDKAPPNFPNSVFATGWDGDDGLVDISVKSLPLHASPKLGRWCNHYCLDPGFIRSVFRPPDRYEVADVTLPPSVTPPSFPHSRPGSSSALQNPTTTDNYGKSLLTLLLCSAKELFSVSTAAASDNILPLADLVRIGDDLDYNTYHDDHFVVNTPSGISWETSFDVLDFQSISTAQFKYTVAGSMVGNPIYINGKQAGELCVWGNAAWNIKDCALNILPYLQAGQNKIKIQCAKYVFDDVTPYDDVEIYNLFIELTRYPTAPSLTSPANSSSKYYRDIQLQWNTADQAVGYQLAIGDNCNTAGTIDASTTTYAPTGLNPETIYFWKVRGYNKAKIYGPWSTCWSFKAIYGCPSCTATNLLLLGN